MIQNLEELVEHALDAFIPVPKNLENYDFEDFPHWWNYCILELGSEDSLEVLNHNAHVISRIPYNEIGQISISNMIGILR